MTRNIILCLAAGLPLLLGSAARASGGVTNELDAASDYLSNSLELNFDLVKGKGGEEPLVLLNLLGGWSLYNDPTGTLHQVFTGNLDWTPTRRWDLPLILTLSPRAGASQATVITYKNGRSVPVEGSFYSSQAGLELDPQYNHDLDGAGNFNLAADLDLMASAIDEESALSSTGRGGKTSTTQSGGTFSQLGAGLGVNLNLWNQGDYTFTPYARITAFSYSVPNPDGFAQIQIRGLRRAPSVGDMVANMEGGLPTGFEQSEVRLGVKQWLKSVLLRVSFTQETYVAGDGGAQVLFGEVKWLASRSWKTWLTGTWQQDKDGSGNDNGPAALYVGLGAGYSFR